LDHAYIDDHDIATLYLRGALNAREREEFEQHFANCPECIDRIALAEIFLQSRPRRRVVAEPTPPEARPLAPKVATAPVPSFSLRIAKFQPWRLWAVVAMIACLIVGLPSAFVAGMFTGKRTIAVSAPASTTPIGTSAAIIMPLMPGVNRLSVASPTVLMIETKISSETSKYRVKLMDSTGELAWERDLQAEAGGPLAVIVPAGALQPGTYSLLLMALRPDGTQTQLDTFTIAAGIS
jgi:putative zinc finger protein